MEMTATFGERFTELIIHVITLIFPCVLSISNDSVLLDLITTEGCKIPAFPIINNDIKQLMNTTKKSNCSENIHILESNSSHIWFVEDYLDLYNVFNTNNFYCCYRHFYVGVNIAEIKYGNCIEFRKDIKARHEYVRVECFHLDYKIYDDFFLFPVFTRRKINNNAIPEFNVLMFGMESMSRMNFMRMMPDTSNFFQDRDSIQLLGYNKLGDNSFPNLFPLLFGQSYKQVKSSCIKESIIDLNKCIMISNLFKKAGYRTALASDSIAGLLGTYEYSLPSLPADYYLQPFIFETRNIFQNMFYNFHQCLSNRYFYKLMLDWSRNIIEFPNKLFGLFWEESISHEHFIIPRSMDEYYLDFFKELDKLEYLNNSIIILFSDHGTRFGNIAQTEQGRVENRLPLFEILFPKLFKDRYPVAYTNFRNNRYRLTTPYDIYETLMDIINLENLKENKLKERSKMITQNTKNVSLFLPVPSQRSCDTIGIEEHWCTCRDREVILDKGHKKLAVNYLINYLNIVLLKFPLCHKLKIVNILKATISIKQNIISYHLVVRTMPGGGIFDATIQEKSHELSISGTVSRLNSYRRNSQCIEDVEAKMYCTCTI